MKQNKKGISLIVLVITIIVIIILAAAVILNLTKNNPINNAKIANLVNNRDALESSIALYLSKAHAETQGSFTSEQLILGNGGDEYSTEPILRKGTEKYRIAYAYNAGVEGSPTYTPTAGQDVPSSGLKLPWDYDYNYIKPYGSTKKIWVYKLQTGTESKSGGYEKAAEVMDMDHLPATPADSASWYVDPNTGKVYLMFDDNVVPQWMTSDGSTDISKIEDPTLLSFVGLLEPPS